MANIKFSQFTPSGGGYTPARATTFVVGYDNSSGPDNVRLTTADLEGLLNWPTYQIALDATNPEIEFTQPTGYSYGGASGTVLFTGSGATTVTRASATEIDISSTDTTSLPVKNAAGTTQFTSDATTGVRFTGTGATTVSFTPATQLVTIDSTDTNFSYTLSTAQNASDADIDLTAGGGGVSSAIKLEAGTNMGITVTGSNILLDATDTDTTYTLTAPNANTIRLQDSGGANNDVSVSAGAGITLNQLAANNINIINSGSFTTQSTTGTISISGSPTSTGGTLNVDQASGIVTPGTYNTANVTVDTYGRVTNIATGSIGVSQIIAGTNVTISPAGGTGAVTVNASGGGGSSNGAILGTNIYHNDSVSANLPASFSFGTATTFDQVQYTTSVGAALQKVGITVNRPATGFVRIQVQCYILSGDSNNVYLGLHHTPLNAIAGSIMQYGWLNPGHSADTVGQVYELNTYWDIDGRDFVEQGEEEPVQVPIGSPATFYLKATATNSSTDMLFSNTNAHSFAVGGVQAGWNGGLNLPTNTSDCGGPCIITAYALDNTTRTVNPGTIP